MFVPNNHFEKIVTIQIYETRQKVHYGRNSATCSHSM